VYVDSLPPFINRLSTKEFCQNAPDRPYIDGSRLVRNLDFRMDVERWSTDVIGEAQHDLGRSVPPRCYIFSHEALISCSFRSAPARRVSSRETKIADFEFAIRIY
jgi:hypothetical protein